MKINQVKLTDKTLPFLRHLAETKDLSLLCFELFFTALPDISEKKDLPLKT